jgi:hypothetical protein
MKKLIKVPMNKWTILVALAVVVFTTSLLTEYIYEIESSVLWNNILFYINIVSSVLLIALVLKIVADGWYFNRITRIDSWVIRKGWSYSNLFYLFPWYNRTQFVFNFNIYSSSFLHDSDLEGKTDEEKKQLRNQINKLVGPCFSTVHSNSIRVGFNWELNDPNNISIFHYTYANGSRVIDHLTKREPFICYIKSDKEYVAVIKIDRANSCSTISIYEAIGRVLIAEKKVYHDVTRFKNFGRFSMPYFENNPKKMQFQAQLTDMSK